MLTNSSTPMMHVYAANLLLMGLQRHIEVLDRCIQQGQQQEGAHGQQQGGQQHGSQHQGGIYGQQQGEQAQMMLYVQDCTLSDVYVRALVAAILSRWEVCVWVGVGCALVKLTCGHETCVHKYVCNTLSCI